RSPVSAARASGGSTLEYASRQQSSWRSASSAASDPRASRTNVSEVAAIAGDASRCRCRRGGSVHSQGLALLWRDRRPGGSPPGTDVGSGTVTEPAGGPAAPIRVDRDETEIQFRSDVTVELVKATAHDSDVVFAARVSTLGEQSLGDVEADGERNKGL